MAENRSDCFELREWYKCQVEIGRSSKGLALKAQVASTGTPVGLKLLWRLDSPSEIKQVLKEIGVMTTFQHPNILTLRAVHCLRPDSICLVTDLMDMSLSSLIQNNSICSTMHIRLIMYQTLDALRCINAAGISHTGISHNSVLINTNCDVKITGFQGVTPHGQSVEPCDSVARRLPHDSYAISSERVDTWASGVLFLQLLTWNILPGCISSEDILRLARQRVGLELTARNLLLSLLEGSIRLEQALNHPYFQPLGLELDNSFTHKNIEALRRLESLSLEELRRELSLHYTN